jgi:predicted nuclease of predicted toxin-antitoxin system
MQFLMDENADAHIADFLLARGHAVEFSRNVLGVSAPDNFVAAAADRLGAIVITRNYRHFRRLIRRSTPQEPTPYPRAGLICFRCDDAIELRRIEALIEAIEAEYEIVQRLADPRLIVEITDRSMQTVR